MKKFLAGTAIANLYTTNGELIGISDTQINDTINLSVESQEVRSGQGNGLDFIYYHSSRMEGSLEDAQFNLDYIKHNIGAKESHEAQIYKSVNHTLTKGENTITGVSGLVGTKIWCFYKERPYTFEASYNDGTITFTNNSNLENVNVCIKYLDTETGTNIRNLTVGANIIPDVITIILEANLFASESGVENSSRIGRVLFKIPKAQLSGTQEISLNASGVASTPLSYLALKADDETANACASATGVYGYITEILETEDTKWYDGVKMLAIEAVDDALTVANNDYINTYAITEDESFIVKPRNRLKYGYNATTAGETPDSWLDVSDANMTVDGQILNKTNVKKVFVKVDGVDSIKGDSAIVK